MTMTNGALLGDRLYALLDTPATDEKALERTYSVAGIGEEFLLQVAQAVPVWCHRQTEPPI